VAGPELVVARPTQWLALVLPAVLATASARLLFETFRATDVGRAFRHVPAAVPAAILAAGLMAGADVIAGLPVDAVVIAATAMLAALALVGAGVARDIEIRLRLSLRRVYFVGSAESQRDLERELSRRHDARLVGAAAARGHLVVASLVDAVRGSNATVVVLDRDAMQLPALVDAASKLNIAGLRIRDLVSYYESEFKKVPLTELTLTWFLFDIAPIHRRPVARGVRRVIEAAVASILLLVSLPVLIAAALAIRLTSSGPALFRQRRVGRAGAHFTLVKLRTMTMTDEATAEWAPAHTHRITPVGRFLRRFRLDELPQLWNVIAGDLALIGPRPEQVPIVEELERAVPYYGARHCIRPGITGWAQVNLGYGGSVEGTIAKLQRDLYYIKHASVRLDALILWLTLKTVLSGRG
jgi:exopolysaccharide biosynthesis polyprenyl glycosylphosphotransferase